MRKNYQILLCESFYENETFIEKPVCEVGSSTSTFSGQAYNVEFYTKIDGTHELTFNLPRYYYDEYTGKRVKNNLVELIVNKSHLELTKTERNGKVKTFYMVVNNRKDKEEKGVFSYEYSCGDAYIEELGKNGYGLVFDDDVEGNGLGDIHHFAREVAKSSGWEYGEEETGTLRDYTTEMEWNVKQNRYDEVKKLIPVNEIEYIPELERYCYKTYVYKKVTYKNEFYMHPIYCYDDSVNITSSSIRNVLYNGDDFTDTIGWSAWKKNDKDENVECWTIEPLMIGEGENKKYLMRIEVETDNNKKVVGRLLNDTCAEANQNIVADTPYVFNYTTVTDENQNGIIKKLSIYNKNPLSNKDLEPDYSIDLPTSLPSTAGIIIKSKKSFSTPFFVFELDGNITIENISFFPLQGTTDEYNLELIKKYYNGRLIDEVDKDPLNPKYIEPKESTFKSYTEQKLQYVIRDNYGYLIDDENEGFLNKGFVDKGLEEKTTTYLDFESEINISQSQDENGNERLEIFVLEGEKFQLFKKIEIAENPITSLDKPPSDTSNPSIIYRHASTGKFYQYYQVPAIPGFIAGGAWDYALLNSGENGKRRTYKVSKSNHFNIIQDLAELFKVWPVFETTKDKNGIVKRKFYFKEEALRENFSGFHRGVNLVDLTRKMDSNNIVTKIYVEDQANDHAKDGFVTIRTSKFNPWGENFYYNFQYYVNQKLMNVTLEGVPLVEKDTKDLYLSVKRLNNTIYELNYKNIDLETEIKSLKNRQKTLVMCISSHQQRIASFEADLKNENKLGPSDIQTLKRNKKNSEDNLEKWEKELGATEEDLLVLEKEYEENKNTIEESQSQKKKLINDFEAKYRPYIKEGVWSDNSYIENDAYFVDSQKVMNTSSKPQLEWTINVIDGSIATELENFEFEVGDKTILVDNEFFGIEKNGEENYVFEVLISGIKEGLDDATKNTIEVRNYNTSFEELFERISAATQTLELNEQTYNKSAYFTNDGELSADILQKTLINNSLILANASDNSYVLDDSGLTLRSILNPRKQLRLIAEGLFLSNSIDLASGEPEWKTGVTAEGINASLLTAGEINTANIKVFYKEKPNQSWNALGITSYGIDPSGKIINDQFVRLDSFGLYFVDLSDWKDEQGKKPNFQLLGDGTPWFASKKHNEAVDYIREYAGVSITHKGFKYNFDLDTTKVTNDGSITIGYLDDEKSKYGIQVKKNSEIVAQFDNTGTSKIGGFHIDQDRIYSIYESKDFEGVTFEGGMNSAIVSLEDIEWDKEITIPIFYVRNNLFSGLPGLSAEDEFYFIVDAFGNVSCGAIYPSSITLPPDRGGLISAPNLSCENLYCNNLKLNTLIECSDIKNPILLKKNYFKLDNAIPDKESNLEIELYSQQIGFKNNGDRTGWITKDRILYKAGYFGTWSVGGDTLTTGVWLGKSKEGNPLIEIFSGGKNVQDLFWDSNGVMSHLYVDQIFLRQDKTTNTSVTIWFDEDGYLRSGEKGDYENSKYIYVHSKP